jgi:uncharacterized damage-inducible protein DinB
MTERREMPEEIGARLELEWRELLEAVAPPEGGPLDLPQDRRVAVSRAALLAQLEEVREEWRSLERLIDENTAARFANAGWTLKELLAHLASWAKEFRSQIETVSRSESFDYAIPFAMTVLGPNQWNQQEVEARRERTLEAIFREFDGETERLQDLVVEIADPVLYRPTPFPLAPSGNPSERLPVPPAVIISGKCLHDRHHFAQIRKLLNRIRE